MRVKINVPALGQTRWHDYAIRIVFGGLITAGAGIVAKEFGARHRWVVPGFSGDIPGKCNAD
jgi:hypothetical protein